MSLIPGFRNWHLWKRARNVHGSSAQTHDVPPANWLPSLRGSGLQPGDWPGREVCQGDGTGSPHPDVFCWYGGKSWSGVCEKGKQFYLLAIRKTADLFLCHITISTHSVLTHCHSIHVSVFAARWPVTWARSTTRSYSRLQRGWRLFKMSSTHSRAMTPSPFVGQSVSMTGWSFLYSWSLTSCRDMIMSTYLSIRLPILHKTLISGFKLGDAVIIGLPLTDSLLVMFHWISFSLIFQCDNYRHRDLVGSYDETSNRFVNIFFSFLQHNTSSVSILQTRRIAV